MNIVVFGLTISSSWGNGHATLWRGLVRALTAQGHRVAFFERDVEFYALNRDLHGIEGGELVLYEDFDAIRPRALRALRQADAAIVTSYCPDAIAAAALMHDSGVLSVFYDMDTPVTLSRARRGEPVPYIGPGGLAGFDLVLSFTGGRALQALREEFGARRVEPLYGHVDPDLHGPTEPLPHFEAALSFLGTYAADRQEKLAQLFVEPARRLPRHRFALAGAQYPLEFPWTDNIHFVRHLEPGQHAAFFSSSRLTLNITRADMAAMGHCPTGRLFEAAACGTPILTDRWSGLEEFFSPGRELLVAETWEDCVAAIDMRDAELDAIGAAGRARVLAEHSSDRRAVDLLAALERTYRREALPQPAQAGI